jgi:hypothetical protein
MRRYGESGSIEILLRSTGQARDLFYRLSSYSSLPVPPMLACIVPLFGIKAKKIPIVQPNLTF